MQYWYFLEQQLANLTENVDCIFYKKNTKESLWDRHQNEWKGLFLLSSCDHMVQINDLISKSSTHFWRDEKRRPTQLGAGTIFVFINISKTLNTNVVACAAQQSHWSDIRAVLLKRNLFLLIIKTNFISSPRSFHKYFCLCFRHIIFAPSSHNKYAGESFPGIYDALLNTENSPDPESAWNEVKRQISIAAFTVDAAAETLLPPAWSTLRRED